MAGQILSGKPVFLAGCYSEEKDKWYDAIVTMTDDLVKPGDIIAFSHPEDPEIVVVHRVIGVSETGYRTKGDANETPDGEETTKEGLIGVNRFHVPGIGYVVQGMTQTGVEWWIVLILALNIAAELLHRIERGRKNHMAKRGE